MKFTVATPSYNQLDWLRLCIASVSDQSGPSISAEHIVQDAGTPGIEEITREFSATPNSSSSIQHYSSNIAIHSEPDAGMYDAINKAWHRASGDIISYLNTDEQYLPGTLEKVRRFFDEHSDVDLLFGDALVVDRSGLPIAYRRAVKPSAAHTRVVHLGVMSCTMFFRRSWLERGFFFDPQYRAIGDAELVWRMLHAGARIGIIREPLAAFTITGQNLGANPQALAEAAAWRHSAPIWQRAAAPLLRLENWTRKALAGAYAKHPVKTAIYTRSSPSHRVPLTVNALGHHWPG
jgi:glycosyltransferase involved in cell wall biosynthesis